MVPGSQFLRSTEMTSLKTKVYEMRDRRVRREYMKLGELVAKYGLEKQYTHFKFGADVSAKIIKETEKCYLVELSNGGGLVVDKDYEDDQWSVYQTKVEKKLEAWFDVISVKSPRLFHFQAGDLPWRGSRNEDPKNWARAPELDSTVIVYE